MYNILLNFSVYLEPSLVESQNSDDFEIKKLSQRNFVDKIQILEDEDQMIVYPINININSVVFKNITFTK